MEFDIENEKVLLEKDGRTVECDVLFTFDCEDTLKSYVGYTDNDIASNGRKNIYVSSYNPLGSVVTLESITDKKELDMINDVLQQIDRESNI